MADFLKKYWGYVLTVLGAVMFFWQREKLDEADVENTLADTKKTDAVLATQQAGVTQEIKQVEGEAAKQVATPPPTGEELANDLNKI